MKSLALAVAILAASITATAAHAATAPQTFTDPAGDSGTAPDITGVSVNNDSSGQYQFVVSFATDYGPNAQFGLYVDTDKNSATGEPTTGGSDYLVWDDHANHTFEVDKWSGSDWVSSSVATAAFNIANDSRSLTVSINKSDLGDSSAFNFVAISYDGASTADSGYFDDAPSGTGSFSYTLQQTPLTLVAPKATTVTKGRTWSVIVAVLRSDTNAFVGSDGTIACSGKGAGAKLPVLSHLWVSAGGGSGTVAVCMFLLPKKHKVAVTGSVTVSLDGASVTKTVTGKS